MKQFFNGQAAKAMVGLGTALTTWLTTEYPGARWEPAAVAAVGAVLVFLVPNAPKG
ncbi:MAG TPA: hypothetical protein VGS19_02100 [Streptosporangiaceae bacterium]|nr:hypothetical protein [Streptosporangiaceae bacterium]